MSTVTQKPKLTGWAAAAAKAAPATAATSTSTLPTTPIKQNKPTKTNTASSMKSHGANTTAPTSTTKKSKKSPASKPAFNSEQVLEFLQANYTKQANASNTVIYARHASNSPPDWGVTTNNRWKSKKYLCLADVARSLKN
ncbi:Pbp4p LALA0_S01e10924g [Lachancea lanzarotensis]|uniref:LALA0S01e10924g1_1 n=1 Tax=Lachancea lanzarotensis TaxID=1245769 RepID=A0A0C7MT17_9SACH|nr:uncharacterized protein LALA0_S01e10924g [Lachancea lanzarotensis]CEP60439.1 LALA0S01e10924g1_1 [Lachancea lanzarotensis]